MERCTLCHFYDRRNGKANDGKTAQSGQCRRAAPALNPVNAKSYMIEGVWPTVRDDDWCGEWKALVRRVDPSRLNEAVSAIGAPPRPPFTDAYPRVVANANPTPLVQRSGTAGITSSLHASSSGGATVAASPVAFGGGRGD